MDATGSILYVHWFHVDHPFSLSTTQHRKLLRYLFIIEHIFAQKKTHANYSVPDSFSLEMRTRKKNCEHLFKAAWSEWFSAFVQPFISVLESKTGAHKKHTHVIDIKRVRFFLTAKWQKRATVLMVQVNNKSSLLFFRFGISTVEQNSLWLRHVKMRCATS